MPICIGGRVGNKFGLYICKFEMSNENGLQQHALREAFSILAAIGRRGLSILDYLNFVEYTLCLFGRWRHPIKLAVKKWTRG